MSTRIHWQAVTNVNPVRQRQMQRLRDVFESVDELLLEIGYSREASLARTNLEQALMWANKALALKSQTDDSLPHDETTE